MMWQILLQKWFERQLSATHLEQACNKIEPKMVNLQQTERTDLVSCVQRTVKPVSSVSEYVTGLTVFAEQAVSQGCELLVYPEFNFLDLLGLIPGFSCYNRYANRQADRKQSRKRQPEESANGDIIMPVFEAIAPAVELAVRTIMSAIARKYSLHLYSGTYIVREGDRVYNEGALFGPKGNCLGVQRKLHLTPAEAKMGFARGECLRVYNLPVGRVAIPICMDATYFEIFATARALGADIVIIPIANPEEYNVYRALRGIWTRVQESYVIGLKASLNGLFAGMHYTGKAGVFAPLCMSEDSNGVLAIARNHVGDELVTAKVDIEKLEKAREKAEYYGDYNPVFENSLSQLYLTWERDIYEE